MLFSKFFSENGIFDECHPFKTNEELLNYTMKPFSWKGLVHPLVPRCEARTFGDHFIKVEETEVNCKKDYNEAHRPKVLVCHDMAGNYRGDR